VFCTVRVRVQIYLWGDYASATTTRLSLLVVW